MASQRLIGVERVTGGNVSAFADLIVQASDDPALDNNSVPAAAAPEDVIQWFRESTWMVWLVSQSDSVIGYLSLHAPTLTEDAEAFEGHLETDSYLLPPYRGQRLMTAAWNIVIATLPQGTELVAEVWETNTSSQKRLERDGWQPVGTYWWQDSANPEVNGACLRYVYTVGARVEIVSPFGGEHALGY